MRGGRILGILLACAGGQTLVACAATEPAAPVRSAGADERDAAALERAHVEELLATEDQVLRTLGASDPRFAKRIGGVSDADARAASVKALAEGDADVGIEAGKLDAFSFTARARAVAEASKLAAKVDPFEFRDAQAKLERELLARLVGSERLRLDEEKSLPAGASALLHGLAETWSTPESKEALGERDARLAKRLDEVRSSVAGAAQRESRIELEELDEAVDPLEREMQPTEYPQAAKSVVGLRMAIDTAGAAARPQGDAASWGRLLAGLQTYVGVERGVEPDAARKDVRARLERAEKAFRTMASEALGKGNSAAKEREIAAAAREVTQSEKKCIGGGSSRLRTLAPPRERARICGALEVASGPAYVASYVALHDDVVVALWALAMQGEAREPSRATAEAHPFFGTEPDQEAKWLRLAVSQPIAVMGAALAAEALLGSDAGADRTAFAARAQAWRTFGDAPVDLALAHLEGQAKAATSAP